MNTEKVTPIIAKNVKQTRDIKARVEMIRPNHIVDAWKLFEKSLHESPWTYPSLDEETPENLQHNLFGFISSPRFFGMQIRVGKKVVGQILSTVSNRQFGRPKHFAFIMNFYMDPEYRRKGFMKQLADAYFAELKKSGIHYWEANVHDQGLLDTLAGYNKRQSVKRFVRLGGKV